MKTFALGIDIGGTKVAFALVDNAGKVYSSSSFLTDTKSPSSVFLDRIAAELNNYLQAEPSIEGIGIGCPGYVNAQDGVILRAVNLNWHDMPLKDELQQRISRPLPIYVENDGTASALGEHYFGAAKGCTDFVHLAIGTGLGGSAVSHGQRLVGANNYGFEIGHIVRKQGGRLCNCGMRGCVEMYVSGRGLLAGLAEHLPRFSSSSLNVNSSTSDILQAARQEDALAQFILDESADCLAELLSYLVVILNPQKVVIGGGMGLAASDFYINGMQHRLASRLLPDSYKNLEIVLSSLESSVLGPASLVWQGSNYAQP